MECSEREGGSLGGVHLQLVFIFILSIFHQLSFYLGVCSISLRSHCLFFLKTIIMKVIIFSIMLILFPIALIPHRGQINEHNGK